MSTLAVFTREWIGRRNLFLLALGLGFIQLVAVRSETEPGKVAALAVGSGTLLAWAVAALYGATMVARDLEERRFGFLLNQPIRLGEIFLGKVAAGIALSVLAGSLVALPMVLLGGVWRQFTLAQAGQTLCGWPAGSLVALLLFHAVSVQLRSRSLWLLLDLAAWPAFFWCTGRLSRRLIDVGAFPEMLHLWLVLLVVVTLGLGLAGYLQVAEGRADLRRGHRWVSTTLATSLGLALLIGWGQVAWVLKSRPPEPRTQPRADRIR